MILKNNKPIACPLKKITTAHACSLQNICPAPTASLLSPSTTEYTRRAGRVPYIVARSTSSLRQEQHPHCILTTRYI